HAAVQGPGAVGQHRVGGDDEVDHGFVEPGVAEVGDPRADVFHTQVAGHPVLGGGLFDAASPFGGDVERSVADLTELQRVDDLAHEGEVVAVHHHSSAAVLHGLGDPVEDRAQFAEGDGLAVAGGVEVRMLRVELVEQPVGQGQRVVFESRTTGQSGLVVGVQRHHVSVFADGRADGGVVAAGDAVELTQRGGELVFQGVALR